MAKVYHIKYTRARDNSTLVHTGTIEELQSAFSYTLAAGASWAHEKGNKKINRTPKTAKGLVSNLNNAVNNAAANGYAGITYSLVESAAA